VAGDGKVRRLDDGAGEEGDVLTRLLHERRVTTRSSAWRS
jgi:hypothetical protein